MEPVAPERRHGGDGHGGVDIGGFDFQLANVDDIAPRMEELAAQAAIQQMPAAELLAEALESEAKLATLEETHEELVRYSMELFFWESIFID